MDLLAAWTFSPRTELGIGYSHFFAGTFYRTNPAPPLYAGDADFFYTQLSVRF